MCLLVLRLLVAYLLVFSTQSQHLEMGAMAEKALVHASASANLLGRERCLSLFMSHAAAIMNDAWHGWLVLRQFGYFLKIVNDLVAFHNL
jgi:hypothetical protein